MLKQEIGRYHQIESAGKFTAMRTLRQSFNAVPRVTRPLARAVGMLDDPLRLFSQQAAVDASEAVLYSLYAAQTHQRCS